MSNNMHFASFEEFFFHLFLFHWKNDNNLTTTNIVLMIFEQKNNPTVEHLKCNVKNNGNNLKSQEIFRPNIF